MSSSADVIAWRCHICDREFADAQGGLCRSCNRATCDICWGDQPAFLPRRQTQRVCKDCGRDTLGADSKRSVTVHEAIAQADAILPGHAAPEGERDPRWQAVIAVAEFIDSDPEAVWSFILRWGCSEDGDLQAAIATCALEHLLEHHFDAFIARVEESARGNFCFARTVSSCWKFGQSKESGRAARFDRLKAALRGRTG